MYYFGGNSWRRSPPEVIGDGALAITPLLGIITRPGADMAGAFKEEVAEEKQLEVMIITIRLGSSFADNTINPLLIKPAPVPSDGQL